MFTITLINPPVTMAEDARRVHVAPLGLAYIASALRQNPSFQVTILDAVVEGVSRESRSLPGYVTVGLTPEEIAMRMAVEQPALVGVSFISSDQTPNALAICGRLKQLKKERAIDITVVAGGPHVTALPQDVMRSLDVDYGVIGEGEMPFFRLCDALANFRSPVDIPAVCYRDRSGEVRVNRALDLVPDLDDIPFPAYDLLPMQRYTFAESYYGEAVKPHFPMVLYRGCESACLHCQVPRMFGMAYRKRSPGNIVSELQYLKKNYSVEEVEFMGDNLFADRKWAKSWMEAIVASKLEIRWSTLSGQACYNIDEDMMRLALASGMRSLIIDFPTTDEVTYEEIYQRPGTLENVDSVIKTLRRSSVYVGGLFSIGAPAESRESMARTVKHALSLPLNELHVRAYTPFPGTPAWDLCLSRKMFTSVPTPEDLLRDRGYVESKGFSSRDLLCLLQMAHVRLQTRDFLGHPEKLVPAGMKFLRHAIFHPVDSIVKVVRYAGSHAGLVAKPQKATARRHLPKPAKSASPEKRILKSGEESF